VFEGVVGDDAAVGVFGALGCAGHGVSSPVFGWAAELDEWFVVAAFVVAGQVAGPVVGWVFGEIGAVSDGVGVVEAERLRVRVLQRVVDRLAAEPARLVGGCAVVAEGLAGGFVGGWSGRRSG
jgi:hypothetical protein